MNRIDMLSMQSKLSYESVWRLFEVAVAAIVDDSAVVLATVLDTEWILQSDIATTVRMVCSREIDKRVSKGDWWWHSRYRHRSESVHRWNLVVHSSHSMPLVQIQDIVHTLKSRMKKTTTKDQTKMPEDVSPLRNRSLPLQAKKKKIAWKFHFLLEIQLAISIGNGSGFRV
jgi:hypothetical protein